MAEQKEERIITVFGATGAQGGAVVKSLLADKDGNWKLRGVTRNPDGDKGKALAALGVEVVKADLLKLDQVEAALKGAYGAFILTNFWDPSQMGKEFQVGKPVADLAKKLGLKHVVFSSLPNVEEESKDKYDVPHFTHKAKLFDYFKKIGVPTSSFEPAFYFQNFGTFFQPFTKDGVDYYTFPEIKNITGVDITETGDAVKGIFNNPKQWIGKRALLSGSHISPATMVTQLGKAQGKKTALKTISYEEYGKLFPGAKELGEMFGWFNEFTYFGSGDFTSGPRALGRVPKSFEQYVDQKYKK